MAHLIYILGVEHSLQFGFYRHGKAVDPSVLSEFVGSVEGHLEEFEIDGVFEELSGEALARRRNRTTSVVEDLCGTKGIRYEAVEPTSSEIEAIFGNLGRKDACREEYWLDRIDEADKWRSLLICGAAHALPFGLTCLRRQSRWACSAICLEWTPRFTARSEFVPIEKIP